MTPKEKAQELVHTFEEAIGIETHEAKKCAMLSVNEIESALTDYGRDSYELQNMESEWRFWDAVKREIETL